MVQSIPRIFLKCTIEENPGTKCGTWVPSGSNLHIHQKSALESNGPKHGQEFPKVPSIVQGKKPCFYGPWACRTASGTLGIPCGLKGLHKHKNQQWNNEANWLENCVALHWQQILNIATKGTTCFSKTHVCREASQAFPMPKQWNNKHICSLAPKLNAAWHCNGTCNCIAMSNPWEPGCRAWGTQESIQFFSKQTCFYGPDKLRGAPGNLGIPCCLMMFMGLLAKLKV